MTTDPPYAYRRNYVWPILKLGLCLAVVVFVAIRAAELWNKDELQNARFHAGWLAAAMVVYVVGWIPSAWYWRQLMRATGQNVGMVDCIRGYFCGHLGKYIPGKAFVLIIRAGMMKARGHSAAAAAVTATYETLLLMGTGLAVGFALFPITHWPPQAAEWFPRPWLAPVVVGLAVIASLPVLSVLLTRFATMMTPKEMQSPEQPIRIPVKLVATGLAVFCVSWALLGLSLGFTIQAVSDKPFAIANWPMWTGAAALATSVGFIAVFAPGGLGVREGLLIEVLRVQPALGQSHAVIVSVLLRLIWLAAEIIAAVGLYYGVRYESRESRFESPETKG